MNNDCYLLLGGAGLVGRQIATLIASELRPKRIIISSLKYSDALNIVQELETQFVGQPIKWESAGGNIFVRSEFADMPRHELIDNPEFRGLLFEDLYGSMDEAYEHSHLVRLIQEYEPEVIIDAINTATAISYQDIYTASVLARKEMNHLAQAVKHQDIKRTTMEWTPAERNVEVLMLTEPLAQLTRHMLLLHRAMTEVGTRLYLKIGTTGTGGMGLNVPYTHSEDRPSAKLLTKSAVAFAHTGLMFLMARTPNSPIVKEIKPGAMIGYADITQRKIIERGEPVYLYDSHTERLAAELQLRESPEAYRQIGELEIPVVNTGENGFFTKGEFEAITALDQMEFITPEEIAREAVLEIKGSNTGQDVIAAINGAVLNPTYRAGFLRQQVLAELTRLEDSTSTHSVALGQLGPPEISKLLWEAELLKMEYGEISHVLVDAPGEVSRRLYERIKHDAALRCSIISIGVPILTPDGLHLTRGPFIRIPEIPGENCVPLTPENIDAWAARGWIDLRPKNVALWQNRFQAIVDDRKRHQGEGSAAYSRKTYTFNDIRIGEIVGWIFNNELQGYRQGVK